MSLNFTFHLPGYFPGFSDISLERTVETGYIDTTVYPTFYKHTVVEFNVPDHWGACKFDVYKSESDVGPWAKITDAPIDSNFFKDINSHNYSKYMKGWYIVECRLPDGRRIQGPATSWENKRSNWVELRAKEIERRAALLLEKFTGVRTLVFRRRHFGARCPECWDFQTEKVTKDHCKTCLGTGFKGGYFPGFETLFQYDGGQEGTSFQEQGRVETSNSTAWTVGDPHVEDHDVILRVPDFKLYRVEGVEATKLQTKLVRQVVTLVELEKESIEFELAKQVIPEAYQ
jgi:hypothetical protein